MDGAFWLDRWKRGQIGFHQDKVLPLLAKHWPALELADSSRVLVPLCGKSLDMLWLAEQGHEVLGIELSSLAVQHFFEEAGLQAERFGSHLGEHYRAGAIEIICGDAFAFGPEDLVGIDAVYDRAALIALPPSLRQVYADSIYRGLPSGCRGLLITLEYDQAQMEGPPFSVPQSEVETLLHVCTPELLERRDLLPHEPDFRARGLTALDTAVYALTR